MAKITELTVEILHFRARVSFMDIRKGEESVMPLDPTVQGWLNAGLIERLDTISVEGEVHSGPDPVGPSSSESDLPSDFPE